jgi:nuclear pore complex protein Nup98-Nup96
LKKQKSLTLIEVVDGIPLAKLEAPFKYSDMFEGRAGQDPATAHEKLVWELASVLFEPLDVPVDLEGVPGASERLRKDNLSAFWQKLVEQSATRDVAMAKSSEEKAIASLSGHRIPEACQHLLAGKNFHLATLIALIGGSESVKRDIREQLNEWQKSRVLSEISQPIRALYEFLAGNVLLCDGAKGAPIEDRVETFVVSERFGLDWRRAFGLRLWYAITSTEGIETAVKKFAEDLKQDKETAKPFAWYVEQNISPLWDDQVLETREDLLWGLLKLFADPQADLEAVLRPENSQLSPLNFRMSWQLSRALTAFGRCSYGVGADEKADQLTLSFASQLTNEGNWLDAAFVLLHLSSSKARSVSIQELLAHHADRIGSEDSKAFVTLTRDFCIPATWLWEAKALYMRSVLKDSRREVEYLLRAGAYVEAHRTFSKDVAPTAVVERDWETLRALLAGFRGKEQNIPEWRLGGELYVDYLDILEVQKKGLSNLNSQTLERLFAALPAMVEHARHASFLEIVAVQDISGVLAKLVVELGAHGQVSIVTISLIGQSC